MRRNVQRGDLAGITTISGALSSARPQAIALGPLARKSRADAERAVDELWTPAAIAA